MAVKPTIRPTSITPSRVQRELNAIYWNSSENYRRRVLPVGDKSGNIVDVSTQTLRSIGNAMLDYKPIRNEFIDALYNRLITEVVTSKSYENPWSFLKRGMLELGETIEEVFVGLAKAHDFNPEQAEQTVFKREEPNVYSAFHSMNYQKFYKATTSRAQLRQAFLSWGNLVDFVSTIISKLYDSAELDEFIMMKNMIASAVLNGYLYPKAVGEVNESNMKKIAANLRGSVTDLTFMDDRFNLAGVDTYSNMDDIYIFMDTDFESTFSVEVLADAFNMDKATYLGHRVLVNGFGNLYSKRADELFKNVEGYEPFTPEQIDALNSIPAIVFDKDWFMIWDNLKEFDEIKNPEGLYWNHTHHVWQTWGTSPFANAIVFTPVTPAVNTVEITPTTATVAPGQTAVFTSKVDTVGFAPKTVTWSTDYSDPSILNDGVLSVPAEATSGSTINVTVTSTFDGTKTATAVVTVG